MANAESPIALVTGANRGIGLEFVKQLAQRGFNVKACCRTPEKADELNKTTSLIVDQGGMASVEKLDVTNADDIKALAKKFSEQAIDVVICNAGIMGTLPCNFESGMDVENFNRIYSVNSIAPVMLVKALLPSIIKGERKLIVGLSSGLGSISDNGSGGNVAYRMSKSALNMAMKCMACELGKNHGVSAFAILPGWVQTDMGGSNAKLTKEKSVEGMLDTIGAYLDNSKEKQNLENGGLYDYNGKKWDW